MSILLSGVDDNPMNKMIKKMRYADIWTTDDTCKLLSEYNSEEGNELYFRDLLYSAKKAKKIKPIYIPPPSINKSRPQPDLRGYDYEYNREDILDWIMSKSFSLPSELIPIASKKQNTISSDKIESTNMHIIAGMLAAMLGHGGSGVKNSRFENQESIIDYLTTNYKLTGISKRTLESRFSDANKILKTIKIAL